MFGFNKKEKSITEKVETESFYVFLPKKYIEKDDNSERLSCFFCKLKYKGITTLNISSIPKELRDTNFNLNEFLQDYYDMSIYENREEYIDGNIYNYKRASSEDGEIIIYYWTTRERYNYLIFKKYHIKGEEELEIKEVIKSFQEKEVFIEEEESYCLTQLVNMENYSVMAPENYKKKYDCIVEFGSKHFNVEMEVLKAKDVDSLDEKKIRSLYGYESMSVVKSEENKCIYNGIQGNGMKSVHIAEIREVEGSEITIVVLLENTVYNEEKHSYIFDIIDSIKLL